MPNPTRSSPLGFRVTPRVAYLLKLAARERDCSPSKYVEGAVQHALTENPPFPDQGAPMRHEGLWNDDPALRFLLLATSRPDLLTLDERRLWNLLSGSLAQRFTRDEFLAAYNNASVDMACLDKGGEA